MTAFKPSGLMVPVVSTFAADGEIDSAAFRKNIALHLEHHMDGVLVAGSSGEAPLLDDAERRLLIAAARESLPSGKALLAGVGSESTKQTIARARDAAEAGADAVLVVPPNYFLKRMSDAALKAHYTAVADSSPIPVMLYNMPAYTHVVLSPELVHTMAQHPNVIGMKDSAGNMPVFNQYLEARSTTFHVLTGNGTTVDAAIAAGAQGAILAIALYAGPVVRQLVDAAMAGNSSLATDIQQRMTPIAKGIAGALGPAGIKAAMTMVGLSGGAPRAPLLPLSESELEQVRELLVQAGLIGGVSGSALTA